MPKTKQWFVKHGEDDVVVYYVPKPRRGKPFVMVDGMTIPVDKSSVISFVGIDQPFRLGERECHLVVRNGKPQLSVDGRYVESGRIYKPLQKLPGWIFLFIVACLAMIVVSRGGFIPVILALSGIQGCVSVVQHDTPSKIAKFFLCLLVTVAAWGLLLLIAAVMISL